jgi:hypothetical protein
VSKTFETKKDRDYQARAVELLIGDRDLRIVEHPPLAVVDYTLYDGFHPVAAVEVKGVRKVRSISDDHRPLVGVRKLVDAQEFARQARIETLVFVWAYSDGIKYCTLQELRGEIYYGGRKPREGSANDLELMFRDTHTKWNIKTFATCTKSVHKVRS